jgi:serine/threonine protein kinase
MSGCPTQQQLDLYLDERLPPEQRAWLEGHVSACHHCQQVLERAAAQGDGVPLRTLRAVHHPQDAEPKRDLLMRIEQAGMRAARTSSRSDVIVGVTSSLVSPADAMPGVSSASVLPDKPTRLGPAPGANEDAAMILQPGTILGQYRILEPLGAGGMGQVYKAVHVTMDRTVALKVIAPHLLKDARARARFQQEVRTAAKLHHPNIVMAHDAAEADGLSFLVMEYVEGTTLSTLVGEHGLPPVPLACEIIRQAAMGLQHAQDKGMVHRDIKPGNLMVSAQHTPGGGAIVHPERRGPGLPGWPTAPLVKILDFGVARLRELGPDGEPVKMQTLTQEGCVVGTPEFMSPEQACDSRNVDVRSDIYSLGCTLYYLLTGRPPFSGATALETMVQHLKQPLPPISQLRPGLPPGLVAVVNRMLAKAADERFATPAQLAEALRPWIGEFASSVAPDVRLEQRGLSATAPNALASAPVEPLPRSNGSQAKPAGNLGPQPAPESNTRTYLALLLLFVVSMATFLIILAFLDRGTKSDQPNEPDSTTGRLDIRMLRVSSGKFHRWYSPADSVTIFPYELEVAATEVTRGQFAQFVRERNHVTMAERADVEEPGSFVPAAGHGGLYVEGVTWKQGGPEGDDHPVTCITWDEATLFCDWLSEQQNKEPCYERSGNPLICHSNRGGYRLPTEAEWEYAARAGSTNLLPAEGAAMHGFGWFRQSPDDRTHPVGGLKPNRHGLHDMWGNVWEWCWDWYEDVPKEASGPGTGKMRAVWGGGWNDTPAELAKKTRKGLKPDYRALDVGFRVVRTVRER